MGNSFGQIFKVTNFGESHGAAVGVVIDGCPAGLEISENDIQVELDRRRPGQSEIVTKRDEADEVLIMSGVFEGRTTGAPIMMMTKNEDARSEDYHDLKDVERPGHADEVYEKKYGVRDWRGGGRASARVTWGHVAAGAVARKFLKDIEIVAYVEQVGELKGEVDSMNVKREDVEANVMRCPDAAVAEKMTSYVEGLDDDSCGGIVGCVLRGVPVGLGEPIFGKLSAELGKAMLSINAVKGFEMGAGFEGVKMKGSEFHADSSNAGGCFGGISSGEDIFFRVAFKPVSTIGELKKGRHDACVLPRAVPIVEGMAAIVLMDYYLLNKVQKNGS